MYRIPAHSSNSIHYRRPRIFHSLSLSLSFQFEFRFPLNDRRVPFLSDHRIGIFTRIANFVYASGTNKFGMEYERNIELEDTFLGIHFHAKERKLYWIGN